MEPFAKAALSPIRNLRRDFKRKPVVPDEVNRQVRQRLGEAEMLIEKQMLLQLESLSADLAPVATGVGSSKPLDLFFSNFPGISSDAPIAQIRAALAHLP